MKRLLAMLVLVLAFTLTSAAQTSTSSTSSTTQTKSKKSATSSETTGQAKTSTVTGCVSKEPDANGMYTLTNGHYKKGVEIGPTDKIKEHAGHTMQLTGTWSGTGADKKFEIASLKHLSPTCTMGAASKAKMDMKK